jgi:Fe-S-cluster containining protein
MTLTAEDVGRIEALGHQGFWRQARDGSWPIRNRRGRCVFLRDGVCAVYPARPDGCRLYPLILDLEEDRVLLDDFCPHRHEFSFTAEDEAKLRRSLEVEEDEAMTRRARG